MPTTYEPIATTTLGSDTATVTFSSIPATYTDLIFVINSKFDGAATTTDPYLQVNGSAGTNYSGTFIRGNGTTASSNRTSNTSGMFFSGGYGTEFGTMIWHFLNYSNTTTNKTVLLRADQAGASAYAQVFLWRSTSAINEISITGSDSGADKFVTGSRFTLYGIKAA